MKKVTRVNASRPQENFAAEIVDLYWQLARQSRAGALDSYADFEVSPELAAIAGKQGIRGTLERADNKKAVSCDSPKNNAEAVMGMLDVIHHDSLYSRDKLPFDNDYVVHTFWQRVQDKGLVQTPTQFARSQEHGDAEGRRPRKGKIDWRRQEEQRRRNAADNGEGLGR